MTWKITVKPTDHLLTEWVWVAERADGENYLSGSGGTHADALANAKNEVDVFEARMTAIADATTVEDYLPVAPE